MPRNSEFLDGKMHEQKIIPDWRSDGMISFRYPHRCMKLCKGSFILAGSVLQAEMGQGGCSSTHCSMHRADVDKRRYV